MLDCVRNKNSCLPKNATMKVKRQAIEWDKIFTVCISDKISKELPQNNDKDINSIEKWAKDLK